jgi:PAS domain S-box-containing protein
MVIPCFLHELQFLAERTPHNLRTKINNSIRGLMTEPDYLVGVLNRIKENIIAFDNEGTITYFNKSFAALLGPNISLPPSDNVLGKNIWKLFPQLVETSLYKNVIEAINKKEA